MPIFILSASHNNTMQYYLLYKPYDVLCQFTDSLGRKTLKDFGPFPKDVYSVGRLDIDSEGLLLLTNDNEVNHRLTEPEFEHPRTYLVQVEGIPSPEALAQLERGVVIQGEKTKPVQVRLLEHEPQYPSANSGNSLQKKHSNGMDRTHPARRAQSASPKNDCGGRPSNITPC